MASHQQKNRRARDFGLYLLISALVIGAVVLVSYTGLPWEKLFNWVCFAGFSAALFGYFISDSRPMWKEKMFWLLTGFFLVAHTLGFMAILAHVEKVKPIWFIAELGEFVIFAFCRETLLASHQREHR